ncbi:hhat-2 [Pristionchus pacificus]|uniref:Hhat-2 n=1 Tax=Pristionchus pacificus TaxID=54126 RepID=A0A2A6BX44_PRIPA|nr:hhat-2 [Pristionchus pacificus]|eukprot:PDM70572.1 hhat-2 [Pristionchus pacificus]
MNTREGSKEDPGRFYPATLPKWELILSYAVWIFHKYAMDQWATGFSTGFETAITFLAGKSMRRTPSGSSIETLFGILLGTSLFLAQPFLADDLTIAYAVHSSIFQMTYRFLSSHQARIVQIVLSIALHVWVTSLSCILVLAAFAAVTIAASAYFRREIIAWVLCIGFILQATEFVPFTKGAFSYYREFNMYLYGAIKILNASIHLCRNSDRPITAEYVQSIMHYMTYLPYSMTLIVLYEEFTEQINTRSSSDDRPSAFDLKSNFLFGARLFFWAIVFESLIHLIPVNALFASPFTIINGLNGYEMSSIAYVVGQYFHVKYVVIFGVPSLFARIDGMTPPPPPICISRVSRYSRMWRHFDAGLYSFLKNQVYVPLLTHPKLSSGFGRPLALISAFLVVVAWHGTQRHFVCWVTLSALELVIERIGVLVWDTASFQAFRQRIGELWLRRLIAFSMLATVIPGIFGVFFFLGNEGVGETIFIKVLLNGIVGLLKGDVAVVDGVPSAGMVFLNLIVLGYFFNHCCLEFEYRNRKAPQPHRKIE